MIKQQYHHTIMGDIFLRVFRIVPPFDLLVIMQTRNKAVGLIDCNSANPQPHELSTAIFLSQYGFNVKFIPVSNVPGTKTPDIILSDRLPWEIKSIKTVLESTIKHTFSHAIKQSPNIIFDLRTLSSPDAQKALSMIARIFTYFRNAKRLMIITKDNQLLKYSK